MGLRELKKEQTRQLIAGTAWRLFADRGFDKVTVAEIAREAQVAEATVFNYFPSKEDLFYSRFEAFSARLADAVRDRDPGEPALAAFRRALLEEGGLLAQAEAGDEEALARLRTVNRVIAESPALLAREQQAMARSAADLAALLAAETGAPRDDLRPQVVANALLGLQRAMIDYVRRRVSSGENLGGLAADVRKLTAEAFALLEHGLAGYAARAVTPNRSASCPRRPSPPSAGTSRSRRTARRSLQRADVHMREQPALARPHRHQRDPEPPRVVVALPAGLLRQHPDPHGRGPVVTDLQVRDGERPVHQAVGEAGQPLIPGQDEAERSYPSELAGQEPVQAAGVVLLLGRRPALHQVKHPVVCGHRDLPP